MLSQKLLNILLQHFYIWLHGVFSRQDVVWIVPRLYFNYHISANSQSVKKSFDILLTFSLEARS